MSSLMKASATRGWSTRTEDLDDRAGCVNVLDVPIVGGDGDQGTLRVFWRQPASLAAARFKGHEGWERVARCQCGQAPS